MNFFVIILLWQHILYFCTLFLVQGGKWTQVSPLASLYEKQVLLIKNQKKKLHKTKRSYCK